MIIDKAPKRQERYKRKFVFYPLARVALKAFLLKTKILNEGAILLPSYIGWSPKEGSGVFDPIRELNCHYYFYRVDRNLFIDVEDLKYKISNYDIKALVLIHYFGYLDPNLFKIIALAREAGIIIIEDEAHAMLTDLIGGLCGRAGDVAIFSLHKLLPFSSGGVLVINKVNFFDYFKNESMSYPIEEKFFEYDFAEISKKRRENAIYLSKLLSEHPTEVYCLRNEIPSEVVPQSFPIIITKHDRDDIYYKMNQMGFGVISLYHTLISEIKVDSFPDSHWLSKRILNLPIHQDVNESELEKMFKCLLSMFTK